MTDLLRKLKDTVWEGYCFIADEKDEVTAFGVELLEDNVYLFIELKTERLFLHYLDTGEEYYITDLISSIFDIVEEE